MPFFLTGSMAVFGEGPQTMAKIMALRGKNGYDLWQYCCIVFKENFNLFYLINCRCRKVCGVNNLPVNFIMPQYRQAGCFKFFIEGFVFKKRPGFGKIFFVQVARGNGNVWMKRPVIGFYFIGRMGFKKIIGCTFYCLKTPV